MGERMDGMRKARFRGSALHVIAVTALLLVTLAACSGSNDSHAGSGPEPQSSGSQQASSVSVPDDLVGRWNGGSNEQGHWYYEFQPDGTYSAWPAYEDNPNVLTGIIDVTPSQITFSNGGNPFTVEWSIDGEILFMDGYSYVPA
jgi:hypothetical protein